MKLLFYVRNIPNQMLTPLMADMGYRTPRGGVCHGDSFMYAQALKTDEIKHFEKRQEFLRNLLQQLASDSESVKHHFQAARERNKAKKTQDEKKSEPEDAILLLEVPAYLDNVALAQAPHDYEDVFNKHISQEQYKEFYPFITSKKIEDSRKKAAEPAEQKKPDEDTKLLDMAGIFTRQQLEENFKTLREILREAHEKGETVDDLPFIAYGYSGRHTFVFHYNYQQDVWILRDPNRIKLTIKPNDMPSLFMRSLFEPNHLGLHLVLDVTPTQKKQLPQLGAALNKFQQNIADRIEEMAYMQTDGGLTLLEYALRNKNEKLIKQFRALNKEKSLKTRGINVDFVDQSTGRTAGHFVAAWNDVEIFETAVELGINFATPNALTRQTVLQSIIYGKADTVAMAMITEESKMWSLEKGMYVEADKSTALHHAVLGKRSHVLAHILSLLDKQGGGDEWVVKQINLKNAKGFSAIDYAFVSTDEDSAVLLINRLLRCANRQNKVELFQQALEQGYLKVCDTIVASLKDESKADEKLLFLQLASNSTGDDLDPLDVIINLIKKNTAVGTSISLRNQFYNVYHVSGDLEKEWQRGVAIRNDLLIVELMKRHSRLFQNESNREKFNKFICDNLGISPMAYREFLRLCESPVERNSYINANSSTYRDRPSSDILRDAVRNKQEDVALDLINLGVDPLKLYGKKTFLHEAIENNLQKLTEIFLDKSFQVRIKDPSPKLEKSAFIKDQLNPLREQNKYRDDSLFEVVIRKGNISQVKQLYKLMEDALALEDKQAILRFACHHGNSNMFKSVLDLLSPDKKDIDKLTAHYFETLFEQLHEIQNPHPHKSIQEKQKSFQNLLFMIREFQIPLTLDQKKLLFSRAEDLEFNPAKAFILNSFNSTTELKKFIELGRFFRYMDVPDVIKFVYEFSDDKMALKQLLFRNKNEDGDPEKPIFEIAIRDNDRRAILFIDFLLDLLSEDEKKSIFTLAIKYNKGALADKILATVPAEREAEFMGDLAEPYKELCPATNLSQLRDDYQFQQAMAEYFKDSKNMETLNEFRTAVLTGNAAKVNDYLEKSLPKDKLLFYLEHRDAEGRTVLFDALLNCDEAMALDLHRAGAKKYTADRYHFNPFIQAVYLGADQVVESMLSSSKEKNIITIANVTNAIANKHDDIVMLFIKHHVHNEYFVKNKGDAKEEYQTTFLHEAVSNGMEKSALGFAASHEHWNLKDTKYGSTPTHLAAMKGNPVILRGAIAAGADFFVTDNDGKTPADYLVSFKRYDILVELLETAKNSIVLGSMDLQHLKDEFIRQIEKQTLQNPELALARLQKVCDRQNALAAVLFAKDTTPGAEMFSQSRPDKFLSELTQLKTFVEKVIEGKQEPGLGIL
ncbi:MAG: ankyrin repeat domain-containing protein [Gammaproteobacteria bacterium]